MFSISILEPVTESFKNEDTVNAVEEVDADITEHVDDIPDVNCTQNDADNAYVSSKPIPLGNDKLRNIKFDYTADNILDNWSEEYYISKPYLLDKIIRASRVSYQFLLTMQFLVSFKPLSLNIDYSVFNLNLDQGAKNSL